MILRRGGVPGGGRRETGCSGRLSVRVAEPGHFLACRCGKGWVKGGDSLLVLQQFFFSGRRTVSGRVSRREIAELRARLGERDRQILDHVGRLRLLCARQVQALFFPASDYSSPASAARCCRRVLERLTRERLLVRLARRVGGVRAGSASFVYSLGPVGQRVLDSGGPRRRLAEPSRWFVEHTLAIASFLVSLQSESVAGRFELLTWQSEPACWRQVATLGGRLVLRPDLHVTLGTGDYELRWFIEIDRGSEHLPTLLRKCRLYHSYYRSGHEQRAHGVFPRVLWLMSDEQRAKRLRTTIENDRRLTAALFHVASGDDALDLIGAQP